MTPAEEFEKLMYMEDDELLDYAEEHSRDYKPVFSRDHVARLFILAGLDPPTGLPQFVKLGRPEAIPILKRAARQRKRLGIIREIMDS